MTHAYCVCAARPCARAARFRICRHFLRRAARCTLGSSLLLTRETDGGSHGRQLSLLPQPSLWRYSAQGMIQYNSLHHTHRAMLTAARRPDIHRVPHNHSPRHTQSHTLGHWTPWDSDRSEDTLKTTADQTTSPWPHTHSAFLYALLTRCTPRRVAESAQSSGHQAARLGLLTYCHCPPPPQTDLGRSRPQA